MAVVNVLLIMSMYALLFLIIFLSVVILFNLGDEVSIIVINLGSHTCKVGYAGKDAPKVVLPFVTFSHSPFFICILFFVL